MPEETASPTAADIARQNREQPATPPPAPSSRSSSETTPKSAKRTIAGLMIFAGVFSLVGNEIKRAQNPATGVPGLVSEPARIFLGTTIGGTLLLILADAGKPGKELATGLAVITFASAALIYGAPVWDLLGNLFAGKQGPTSTGSSPSTKATGTTGAPTAISPATSTGTGGTNPFLPANA
jgi:hypothetical protein